MRADGRAGERATRYVGKLGQTGDGESREKYTNRDIRMVNEVWKRSNRVASRIARRILIPAIPNKDQFNRLTANHVRCPAPPPAL